MLHGSITFEEFDNALESLLLKGEVDNLLYRVVRVPQDAYQNSSNTFLKVGSSFEVFYSATFQVPILLVIEGDLSLLAAESDNKFIYIEHPIHGLPVIQLHPCNTNTVMKELGPYNTPLDYLITWLNLSKAALPNFEV